MRKKPAVIAQRLGPTVVANWKTERAGGDPPAAILWLRFSRLRHCETDAMLVQWSPARPTRKLGFPNLVRAGAPQIEKRRLAMLPHESEPLQQQSVTTPLPADSRECQHKHVHRSSNLLPSSRQKFSSNRIARYHLTPGMTNPPPDESLWR
jgi:hypothetical protein